MMEWYLDPLSPHQLKKAARVELTVSRSAHEQDCYIFDMRCNVSSDLKRPVHSWRY